MSQIIGTIKLDISTIDSMKVSYTEPGTFISVGHVIDLGREIGLGTIYVVCSEKSFIETSRALNAIVARIFKTMEDKEITFLDALNIYLESMDHFIRVRKSKRK